MAYVTGLRLKDQNSGKTFSRTSKTDHVRFGCIGTGFLDLQTLCSKAEAAERRKDAVVGRHIILALARELDPQARKQVTEEFADRLGKELRVPVVWAIHEQQKLDSNPHAHLVFASRRFNHSTQEFGEKTRELDVRRSGGRIIRQWRENWENSINSILPPGTPRISCASHKDAGRDRTPRRHLGEVAWALEKRGYPTQNGSYNRTLDELEQIRLQTQTLDKQIDEERTALNPPSIAKRHWVSPEAPDYAELIAAQLTADFLNPPDAATDRAIAREAVPDFRYGPLKSVSKEPEVSSDLKDLSAIPDFFDDEESLTEEERCELIPSLRPIQGPNSVDEAANARAEIEESERLLAERLEEMEPDGMDW
ncbi:MobA/MobL family protein [Actomonas aquatica]|uniref:MobA/MobL family protein n=1 Tax=Actomonas aquatica TaxID=2866162 RepID=A0ABZ1C2Y2_9BACT|nr:MobA/MobL family protein [Opitutus sp. WL0086]WRQ85553.1 MobA/MobL family protein [Opitutus sp. WL0086]